MVARRYSAAEKMGLVEEYLGLRHGTKGAWLKAHRISPFSIASWRQSYLYGDLERQLEPRDTAGMDVSDSARFQQLRAQLEAERRARAADQRRHEAELERLESVNEALGKAIGLLHERSGKQEPTPES